MAHFLAAAIVNETPLTGEARYGLVTPEQRARMAADEAEIRRRREAAAYVPILEKRAPHELRRMATQYGPGGYDELYEPTGEVNCARCAHAGDFSAEQQRAWCTWLRHMVMTWHPVVCAAHEAKA